MSDRIDMKEQLVSEMCMNFLKMLPDADGHTIRNVIYMSLSDYTITRSETSVVVYQGDETEKLIQMFLVTKKVNGCTNQTIHFYKNALNYFFRNVRKNAVEVTSNDIRIYFASRELNDNVSATTRDNERRVLSSFFTWMTDEEIITKNPMKKVPQIKRVKVQKKALSDMDIEKLRLHAKTEKDRAIIEILLSTGCRVSELCQIKVSEIDGDKLIVHGKGQKDRTVYLNAKARLAIEEYMKTEYFIKRFKNGNPYLFARQMMNDENKKRPMDKGSVESMLRDLGKEAGIEKVHPHKFRRTFATNALKRGMRVELVSKMLGHESLETTQIYLDLDDSTVETAHRKYVS